jgi:hypothetical protein
MNPKLKYPDMSSLSKKIFTNKIFLRKLLCYKKLLSRKSHLGKFDITFAYLENKSILQIK